MLFAELSLHSHQNTTVHIELVQKLFGISTDMLPATVYSCLEFQVQAQKMYHAMFSSHLLLDSVLRPCRYLGLTSSGTVGLFCPAII